MCMAFHAGAVFSQDLRVLNGIPACGSCTLRVEPRLVIQTPVNAPDLLRDNTSPYVRRDRLGRFILHGASGGILVFDSLGRFQNAPLRVGMGPDEIPPPGGPFMHEGPQGLTLFTGFRYMVVDDAFRELSRGPLPPLPKDRGRLVLADGSHLFVGWHRAASGTSQPAQRLLATHSLSHTGRSSTWELTTRAANNVCMFCGEVTVAAARSAGDFWVLTYGTYQLEKWTTAGGGRMLARYNVAGAPWFGRARAEWLKDIREAVRMLPRVPEMALRERSDGLLVVASRGLRSRSIARTGPPARATFLDILLKLEPVSYSQFDIIDPSKGILASTTIEGRDLRLIDERFAVRFFYDATGTVRAEIWEISFASSQ